MKTKLFIAAVVVALAVSATLVIAAGPGGGNRPGPPPGAMQGSCCGLGMCFGIGPKIADELNLTQDQLTQLKQIRDDFLAQTKDTRDQIKAKMKDIAALFTADNPNPDAIKAAFADIDALKVSIRNAAVDKMIAGMNVLTADQRTKLRELIKNRPGIGMGCMGCCGCCIGCGMGQGMGPGSGMGGGSGVGPGAGQGCCAVGGAGNASCPLK